MADIYDSASPSLITPAIDGQSVSPSDSADLINVSRAIYVGGAGDLAVELASGASVTLAAVPAGATLPLRAQKVYATGTTAGAIVALW